MDYTHSLQAATHSGTGRKLHQNTESVPTEVSAADMNSVIWSLMDVLSAGGIAGAAFNADDPDTYNRLRLAIQALAVQSGDPIGTVKTGYFATSAPTGYVLLAGQTLSRTTDAALWDHAQAIGAVVTEASWSTSKGLFSTGDGATTFRVPLLGGQHVRILDDGAGVDAGRTLGSLQGDQILSHTHPLSINLLVESGSGTPAGGSGGADGTWSGATSSSGGSENRVKTVALRAIMKRW